MPHSRTLQTGHLRHRHAKPRTAHLASGFAQPGAPRRQQHNGRRLPLRAPRRRGQTRQRCHLRRDAQQPRLLLLLLLRLLPLIGQLQLVQDLLHCVELLWGQILEHAEWLLWRRRLLLLLLQWLLRGVHWLHVLLLLLLVLDRHRHRARCNLTSLRHLLVLSRELLLLLGRQLLRLRLNRLRLLRLNRRWRDVQADEARRARLRRLVRRLRRAVRGLQPACAR